MQSILGKKLRMTQLFDEQLEIVPVTVIQAGPCHVLQVKNAQREGYDAVQLGFDERGRVTKPLAGHAAKAGVKPKRLIREFRLSAGDEFSQGDEVKVTVLDGVTKVDVTGISKGRGYQGCVKRHHFGRGPMTHGSKNIREPGSTGMHTSPARVFKGKRMPGQMGAAKTTAKNLAVVKIDAEQNLLFVRGGIPGPTGGYVVIRPSKLPARKSGLKQA